MTKLEIQLYTSVINLIVLIRKINENFYKRYKKLAKVDKQRVCSFIQFNQKLMENYFHENTNRFESLFVAFVRWLTKFGKKHKFVMHWTGNTDID